MKKYIKYITLIKLVILFYSNHVYSQTFYFDSGKYESRNIFYESNTLKKLVVYSDELRKKHKLLINDLSQSQAVKKYFILEYSCNNERESINFGKDIELKNERFWIQHNLLRNSYKIYPDGKLLGNESPGYNYKWHTKGLLKLLKNGCKKELKLDLWLDEVRMMDKYLVQINNFLKTGEDDYYNRLAYLIVALDLPNIMKSNYIDREFEENYKSIWNIYINLNSKEELNEIDKFPSFSNFLYSILDDDIFLNMNINRSINNFIDLSNEYLNNEYSNFTVKEYKSFLNGLVTTGSDINLLSNTEVVMNINDQLSLVEDKDKYETYYTINTKDEVLGMYRLYRVSDTDKLKVFIDKYKSLKVEQYINHIESKASDYYSRVIDQDKSYSRFDKDAFWTCMGTVPIRNVIELEIYCNATATTNYVSYITTDNRYLIPEKKWYKFSIKDDEILVNKWGYLKNVLIYDIHTKSFKIQDESNSPLSFEKDFIESLALKDYDTLFNEFVKSNYSQSYRKAYQIDSNKILLLR